MNFDEGIFFTGGRDGSIFLTTLSGTSQQIETEQGKVDVPYQKMYQTDPKQMITCLKYDEKHGKLWYGTP